MIVMRCWLHIFYRRVRLISICWLHKFRDFSNGLKVLWMFWWRIILRRNKLFDYWRNNFLVHWRCVQFRWWWNDCLWLLCVVFDRFERCNMLNIFWFVNLFDHLYIGWLTSHHSIESILIIGSVFDNSFETIVNILT